MESLPAQQKKQVTICKTETRSSLLSQDDSKLKRVMKKPNATLSSPNTLKLPAVVEEPVIEKK